MLVFRSMFHRRPRTYALQLYKPSESRTAEMIGEAQIIVFGHSTFYQTSRVAFGQKDIHPTTTMPADVDYLKGLLRSYPDYPKKVRCKSQRSNWF